MNYIVFTDLDGTLIDHDTYDFDKAVPGIDILKGNGIPVIFCSSKTRAEQEVLRKALEIQDPFIVEDGGAVYFEKRDTEIIPSGAVLRNNYCVLEFGTPYKKIREIINKIRNKNNFIIRGYGDATVEEVAVATGLSIESTQLAVNREYQETLLTHFNESEAREVKSVLESYGLNLGRGGRFFSVRGNNDKGLATLALTRLYRKTNPKVITVGLGDSWNDLSLFSSVDIPILVQRPGGKWENLSAERLKKVEGIGPVGWKHAVELLLSGEIVAD